VLCAFLRCDSCEEERDPFRQLGLVPQPWFIIATVIAILLILMKLTRYKYSYTKLLYISKIVKYTRLLTMEIGGSLAFWEKTR